MTQISSVHFINKAQAGLCVVMCDGFSADCRWTHWHRDIWILHHASICPPPCASKDPQGSQVWCLFFSLPLILLFLHPALSLSSHRSSDSSSAWSLSLPRSLSVSVSLSRKKTTSMDLNSDFSHCMYSAFTEEWDCRTCLTWLLHDHYPQNTHTQTQCDHIICKCDSRREWGDRQQTRDAKYCICLLEWKCVYAAMCDCWCVCTVCMCLSVPFFSPFWLSSQSDTSTHLFTKESGREEGRRGGSVQSWLSLFIPAPPLPLYLLPFFVLYLSLPVSLSLFLHLLSSNASSSSSPSCLSLLFSSFHLWSSASWPSRCVVCLIVRKCVRVCERVQNVL